MRPVKIKASLLGAALLKEYPWITSNLLPAVKPSDEKPKVIQKSSIRYIHDDPLQIEVRELLKQKYQ